MPRGQQPGPSAAGRSLPSPRRRVPGSVGLGSGGPDPATEATSAEAHLAPARRPSSATNAPQPGLGPTTLAGVSASRLSRPRKHAVCTALASTRPLLAPRAGGNERDIVLALSGGADSSALVLAAAATPWLASRCLVAHIRHDLRPADQTLADERRCEALAAAVGLPFVAVAVQCHEDQAVRNGRKLEGVEGVARRVRYEALVRIARQLGSSRAFVLAGHTQRDQAETVLMRLLRGAGPTGLAAMSRSRILAPGVTLARPFLDLPAEATADACALAGWTPVLDATNADTSRFRAALRHRALPLLEELAPGATARLAAAATIQRLALDALRTAAAGLPAVSEQRGERRALRRSLCKASPAVLAVWIERELGNLAASIAGAEVASEVASGASLDRSKRVIIRRDRRTLLRACEAITSGVSDRRLYRFGSAGLEVSGKWVTIRWLTDAERQRMKRR